MSTILLSLILFNGIIIFYIVIRFKGLFATERNPIVISFVLAFVFQEIFSLLIPFGSKFGDYLSLSVINTIGVLSGLIATHFFFEFAHRLYLFALSPSDVVRNNITKFIGSLSLDTIIRIERVSLAVAIVGILFFESYLGRSTSNTLTTLAVDIHHVPSLLVGRIISHTFIVFYDTCTAYILYLLTRTGYGRRRHIRLRIIFAIAGAFFVVTNEFSNLITTISIFFLPSSADSVLQVWGFYDRFVLLPLGICIIVSAGPVFVVIFVDRLVLYFESLLLLRRVTWIRNIIVERFP